MDLIIQKASLDDVDELLGLYIAVYGPDYPLEVGTNRAIMQEALRDTSEVLWLIMRDTERDVIAASVIFEMDLSLRIGKVMGAVVANGYRGQKVATKLINYGIQVVLESKKQVNSLYATARTVDISSQAMLLNSGFLPLGIFPNARKIKSYETLTLLGMFSSGVLEKRSAIDKVPERLLPIVEICNKQIGHDHDKIESYSCPSLPVEVDIEDDFEFIFAPQFVEKRFEEIFSDDEESLFYPFHKPNLIISSVNTDLEIYASFNKKDHYCVLITANESIRSLQGKFKKLMFSMKEHGIYYVETLIRIDYFESICFLLDNRFLPSAVYPAMREEEGKLHDYVLLTRTMVPLDFSDAKIHEAFKPYVNQYVKQWLHLNLSIVEGVNL